jgi:hypothetical protein
MWTGWCCIGADVLLLLLSCCWCYSLVCPGALANDATSKLPCMDGELHCQWLPPWRVDLQGNTSKQVQRSAQLQL